MITTFGGKRRVFSELTRLIQGYVNGYVHSYFLGNKLIIDTIERRFKEK